ncbi:MAG: radical SAM protein [Patescibacteria group bacterium]|jgi:MoaA/NifB/PqqE/SkfB family radical SAM enzyme
MKKFLNLSKKLVNKFFEGNSNLFKVFLGKSLRPKWLWFGLTERCNSRCQHCNIWKKQPAKDELTLKEIRKCFSDPLFKDIEIIINSGGEVLLRSDIIDIIRLEHEFFPDACLNISTNGLLPERMIETVGTVLKEGIKINASVSLDGIGEEHDKMRGTPGNFKKVDYLLRELVKLRQEYPRHLTLAIGFTLSDLTIESWQKVEDYANNLNIEFIMQWYNQSSFYENSQNNKNQNKEKMYAAVSSQPKTIVREKWLRFIQNKSINFRCFATETFFILRCDGNIAPCLSRWDEILGNVRNNTPTEIWQSDKAKEIRRKIVNCAGCLNCWAVEWSVSTSFYPRLIFYLKKPKAILDRLKRRD